MRITFDQAGRSLSRPPLSSTLGMKDRSVKYILREFRPDDEAAVNEIALAAFEEYHHHYDDWAAFSRIIGNMASLSESGELIVATVQEKVVGAVVYVGAGAKKSEFFAAEWPILRMLVVVPIYRGLGIGRALTDECIRRAERDGAPLIALHTTPIMAVALPMYERLGFKYQYDAPMIFGVPYGIYIKELAAQQVAEPDAGKTCASSCSGSGAG
jgi:ribosomal protein S18 acetylase RimI-like enzyme